MLFQKKTTATVLANFQRTLDDLCEVEQDHLDEAEQHRIAIEQAQTAHEAATKEAAAARIVAGCIQALLQTSDLDEGIGGAAPLRAVG